MVVARPFQDDNVWTWQYRCRSSSQGKDDICEDLCAALAIKTPVQKVGTGHLYVAVGTLKL